MHELQRLTWHFRVHGASLMHPTSLRPGDLHGIDQAAAAGDGDAGVDGELLLVERSDRAAEEKLLEGNRHGQVIRKPVRAAANLPEEILSLAPGDTYR